MGDMYKVGDYVCIKEPEFPELEGITRVTEIIGNRGLAVKIEFDDGSIFSIATRLLRPATEEEIRKYLNE